MKILPVEKIREADAYTIEHEPIADIDLMERAASACFSWLCGKLAAKRAVHIFAGTGNNGGDGLAIARMLHRKNFPAEVYLVGPQKNLSPSCLINFERFKAVSPKNIRFLAEGSHMPEINHDDVIIDSLFGSGLTRPAGGFTARIIRHINESAALTISIDIPSGLFSDSSYKITEKPVIVEADYTLTFSPPKLALFFPENDVYLGEWQLLDIGISQNFIDETDVRNYMVDSEMLSPSLIKRNKYDHKGTFGHALLVCGSYGKMGAAVLSSHAALRSGAGLVTVHAPSSAVPVLQSAVPECMMSIDKNDKIITTLPDLSAYTAIGTGCGLGMNEQTQKVIKLLVQEAVQPVIFDADAINIIAENKSWLGFIPKHSIFTPHPKEFQRLAGKHKDDHDRIQMQREFSFRHQSYVILKGGHTAITTPEGECFFNSTGNPGMATAGSGDVLTGIITGLKAQGYSSLDACLLGVFLHGLAGDLACKEKGQEALIARDIIENTGKAFQTLYGKL
ncbi:MAG: NAD(P)H-hydrate dehydratase [Bacteroidetes bacterium]|nr:MAG: NAD(P)H-hydrate dehydratase [Bacteroidota bacterium]